MHSYTLANCIFDGLITNLLSVACFLTEFLSRGQVKGKKGLNDLKFGTFIVRFWSDEAPSMPAKGLTVVMETFTCISAAQ